MVRVFDGVADLFASDGRRPQPTRAGAVSRPYLLSPPLVLLLNVAVFAVPDSSHRTLVHAYATYCVRARVLVTSIRLARDDETQTH